MAERRFCKELTYSPGAIGSFPCNREIKDDSNICGPHRAGKRRSEAVQAKHQAEWAAQREQWRIQAERAAFVARWREEHNEEVWSAPWFCPLCNQAIQQNAAVYYGWIESHQAEHGPDWTAYVAIGAAEGVTGG